MDQLKSIIDQCDATDARLVAVSKTKPNSAILTLYDEGQRIFGENRVQELVGKYENLPKDIKWHMIGHLQSKKVKYIAPFVSMIHAVDSEKLLLEINKRASQHERTIPVLLQFHIAEESTKYGLELNEAATMLEHLSWEALSGVQIAGVMGMATFTSDIDQVRREFRSLKNIFDHLKSNFFADDPLFKEISMGMSGDYQVALEEGSTMVRIGSLLFGSR